MAIKQRPDSPTNNFATWNPLAVSTATFSNGNLNATMSSSPPARITSTFAVSSDKYYMEVNYQENNNWYVGISADAIQRDWLGMADGNKSIGFWPYNSETRVHINGVVQSFSTTTWASGDIIGVKLDADNEEVSIYKNGNLVGSSVSYSSYGWSKAFFAAGNYVNGQQYSINFGQDPTFGGAKSPTTTYTDANGIGAFYYQPPAGALALCTANLPEMTPTVDDDVPKNYFKALTYTGDGVSNRSFTGVGFQPDFIWIKYRTADASHVLVDSVRGGNKNLRTNATGSEFSSSPRGAPNTFDSDGWTITNGSLNSVSEVNDNNGDFVAWCWKAGGAAVTNNDGSITSTVSANTDTGFSIVSWTGTGSVTTVGHGLSSAPDMVIVKGRSYAQNWAVYHSELGATKWLQLNGTTAALTETAIWNNTAPTSSAFTVGTSAALNPSGGTNITYCWHSVEGYSKFGSYTGNGSADGPFVYCGFRPAFVLWKRTDVADDWHIVDSTRSPYNPDQLFLYPNLTNADAPTNIGLDLLSNGFKLRGPTANRNASGGTYIYMAFAEQPFNYANAR